MNGLFNFSLFILKKNALYFIFLIFSSTKTEQTRNPLLFIGYTEASFASKRSSKMKIHSKNKLEKVCLPKILKKIQAPKV